MQGKRDGNMAQSQTDKKMKSIKVLYSNSHTDRPKISIEGKWLEQLGFHIGDKLQISYGNKFIFISHAADDNQILEVNEPVGAYMVETENNLDAERDGACKRLENMKSRQIKVTSSIHVRQTAGYGARFIIRSAPKSAWKENGWKKQAFLLETGFRWSIRKIPSACIRQSENGKMKKSVPEYAFMEKRFRQCR